MSGPPKKRQKVDFDNNKIASGGVSQPARDPIQKAKSLAFVFACHEIVLKGGFSAQDSVNIDTLMDISSFVLTAFNVMKQSVNIRKGKLSEWEKDDTKTVTFRSINVITGDQGNTHEEKEIVLKYKDYIPKFKKQYKLEFEKDFARENKENGTVTTFLALIAGCSKRMSEVRGSLIGLGVSKDDVISLQAFGLDSSHATLFEGASYPPPFRSNVLKTLGPMTIVGMIAKGVDVTYQEKVYSTYREMFRCVDPAGQLIPLIVRRDKRVMQKLANLCFYGVVRCRNKAFIPYVFFRNAFIKIIEAYSQEKSLFSLFSLSTNALFKNIDFSGKGLYAIYQAGRKKYITYYEVQKGPFYQVYMHAIFGSHKDDLSIMKYMTGSADDWAIRSELDECFKERKSKGKVASLVFPEFKHVCKLASNATTDLAPGSKGQDARVPVFAGKCTQYINKDSALRKKLAENEAIEFGRSNGTLSSADTLQDFCKILHAKIDKMNKLEFGTTDFYPGVKSDGSEYIQAMDLDGQRPLELTGRYWYQKDYK